MECSECLENISALIDGELSGSVQGEMEIHLLSCGNCRQVSDELKLLNSGIVQALENIAVPTSLEERILVSIRRERKKAKQQLAVTALFLVLTASPLILFSPLLWRFVHFLYAVGAILGRAEAALLQSVPPTAGWLIGGTAFCLIIGGILLVRAMLRRFHFNEVFS